MTSQPPAESDSGSSSYFDPVEKLVAEGIEEFAGDWDRALQALCARHPEHAGSIRWRIALLRDSAWLRPTDDDSGNGGPAKPDGSPTQSSIAMHHSVTAQGIMPEQICGFRVLDVLGRGGMGVVYLAEQREPVRRRVALKVIKSGMDSAQVLARFELERQALAMMNHPAVAKVFEAGATEQGQPFFVMELVEGMPVTEYCRRHRLTLTERVQVFDQICHGVQHAHQKGILHRDLKPANILVSRKDDRHVVKLIDFGLARATNQQLVDHTIFTADGALIGTPEYMSPEQAGGSALDIDTRTDIYSLGVILYELLTGLLPFESEYLRRVGLAGIVRVLQEDDPPKPSTRISSGGDHTARHAAQLRLAVGAYRRLVQGELEWIVMKAMAKEPERRYDSALSLSRDLARFLAEEPLEAGPVTMMYRLRKFARRYRAQVIAAAIVVITLVAGIIGVGIENRRANENARIAREASEEATKRAADALAAKARADLRTEEARRESYRASLAAADAAFGAMDLAAARRWLTRCPKDLRGWEWGHSLRRLDSSLRTLHADGSPVLAVAFSPDGARILSSSGNGTVRVWDAGIGDCLHTISLPRPPPGMRRPEALPASISPDRRHAALGSDDRLIIWDTTTGKALHELRGHEERIWAVAYAPDGSRIATASLDATLRIWDATSGQSLRVLRGHEGPVMGLSYSPDGSRIVSASEDETVRIWDASSGDSLRIVRAGEPGIIDVVYSPDGSRILSTSWQGSLRTYDAATGEMRVLRAVDPNGLTGTTYASYSPDGSRILFTTWRTANDDAPDKTVRVLDSRTGARLLILRGHTAPITSACFSPGGSWILSSSEDKTLRVWDARSGACSHTLVGHESTVHTACFSSDGSRIASASEDGSARIWGTEPRSAVDAFRIGSGNLSVDFSANGSRAVVVHGHDPSATVWDIDSGRPLRRLVGHEGVVRGAEFSADGRRILTMSQDSARVWDATSGECVHVLGTNGSADRVVVASFSSDGSRIVVAPSDDTLQVCDADSGAAVSTLRGDGAHLTTPVFSPSGSRVASGSVSGDLRIWDVDTGACVHTLGAHDEAITVVAYSAMGTRIVSGSSDGTLRVWEADSGRCRHTLSGHEGQVTHALFLAGDSRVVSAAMDKSLRIWDVESGKLVRTLVDHEFVFPACVSQDGSRVVFASSGGTLQIWETESDESILTLRCAPIEGSLTSAIPFANGILSVSFSADGSRLLSVSNDGIVRLWKSR